MPPNDVAITTVNLRAADEATYRELGAFVELLRTERWPQEPPVALSERVANWQNMPPVMDVTYWLARDGANGPLLGHAYLNGMQTEENRDAAEFNVAVHPGARRHGVGRRLAAAVAAAALQKGRRPLRRASPKWRCRPRDRRSWNRAVRPCCRHTATAVRPYPSNASFSMSACRARRRDSAHSA